MEANSHPGRTMRTPRPGQPQTLTIRTGSSSARQPARLPSPVKREQLGYPIPIPPEKQAKAVKLYRKYLLEERLARSRQEPPSATSNDGFHLSVPGPTSPSGTSLASSSHQRRPSLSDDGLTDLSSVLSFDGGDESPSSTKTKSQGDFVNYSGEKVKTRKRKKFNPVQKAKAALIRHLGACSGCRERKVPVNNIPRTTRLLKANLLS